MKNLVNTLARQQTTQKEVMVYYDKFFSKYDPKSLFEVYDVNREMFITFPGKEGSLVMNLQTLKERLSEMESNYSNIDNLLVIQYDKNDINFYDPVFIGSEDGFFMNNSRRI